jgi:hypothetical protein
MAVKGFAFVSLFLVFIAGLILLPAAGQTGQALSDTLPGVVSQINASPSKVTTLEEADALWNGEMLFARHSDSTHSAKVNVDKIEDLKWRVADGWNKFSNRKETIPFLCGVAFIRDVVQYRIYDVATGLTFFYQEEGWSSVFPGKTAWEFLNGSPRGAASYMVFDPNGGDQELKTCLEILKNSPSTGSFK